MESAEPFRTLCLLAPVGIYLTDVSGHCLYANPAWCRMAGLDLEEALGPAWIKGVHPEDRARVLANWNRIVASRSQFRMEFRFVTLEGRVTFVLSLASPQYAPSGQLVGYVGVNIDITERKMAEEASRISEERFQKAFHSSPAMMTLTDLATGRFVEVNQTFCAISGFRREEAIGMTSWELGWISREARSAMMAEILPCGHVYNLHLAARNRDGKPVVCLYSGEILHLGAERLLLSNAMDITKLVEGEEQRKILEAEVQHLQRMESLGRLAGGMAHDMNNVLASIMAISSLLQLQGGETGLQAETLLKACCRGRDLVQGLLSFARKEIKEEVAPLDLNALVRKEVELLSNTTLQKVAIQSDLQAGLPLIPGDEGALENALMNLCVNALDAMPEGGILTLRTRSPEQGLVQLVVEDTGQGMSRAVRTRAMEPFFTTKAPGKGTGLGLSLVFGTVQAHRGAIELQSEPGQGTRVILSLPTARHGAGPVQSPAPLPDPKPSPPRRLLLVDDDPLVRASLPALLRALGHQVEVAEGGAEAMALLGSGLSVDLVVLDFNMPGMDGEATLRRLRATHPHLPVLIASGYLDERTRERLRGLPRVTLLNKPYGTEELQAVLKQL